MRFIFRIPDIPSYLIQRTRVFRTLPGSCCVFPLGFGGQSVPVTVVPGVEFCDELLSLELAHGLHRPRVALVAAGIGSHHGGPLCLGDFELSDLKTLRDLYAMPGIFVTFAQRIPGGTSHHEFAGSDLDELYGWRVLSPKGVSANRGDEKERESRTLHTSPP
jgi:hypothetical protein